jgi:ABC-type transport system involved in multi-copper enzyme maturation permease subunit
MIAPQTALLAMLILAALLAGGFLLRRELLTLFGPIVVFDMLRLARRGRYFLLRLGYGCVLVGLLLIAYLTAHIEHSLLDTHHQDILMAEIFFGEFMFAQLFAVSILVPAYVGGAIAEEKERKTLEYVLATPLTSFEIVVGKLVSRIANLILFVLVGLPILSFVQFLGGVDPNLLLAGFAATIVTMIGLGGFSILCSVLLRKARQATVFAFLAYLFYVVLGFIAYITSSFGFMHYRLGDWDMVPTLAEIVSFLNKGNVLVGWLEVLRAMASTNFYARLVDLVINYSVFHLIAGLVFTTLAVWRLRRVANRQAVGEAPKPAGRYFKRPDVSDRPILWKETYVEQKRWRLDWLIPAIIYLSLAGAGGYAVLAAHLSGDLFGSDFTLGVNLATAIAAAVLALLLILGVGIRAAGCISGEREKDTFDAILATPLDSDEILKDKLYGSMLCRKHAYVMIGLIWIYGMIFGGMHIVDVVLLVGLLYCVVRSWAQIGILFSMASRSSSRASTWTALSAVGALFCGCNVLSPVHGLFYIPFASYQFRHQEMGPGAMMRGDPFAFFMLAGFGLGNAVIYTIFAVVSWLTWIKPRFRKMTLRNERRPPRPRSPSS